MLELLQRLIVLLWAIKDNGTCSDDITVVAAELEADVSKEIKRLLKEEEEDE